jgi:hypothetical protein
MGQRMAVKKCQEISTLIIRPIRYRGRTDPIQARFGLLGQSRLAHTPKRSKTLVTSPPLINLIPG